MVRMYPGAMAQVVDGLDGMLRMPCGCFEQTSSSAYPNVLIVDYIKKNRVASPAMLMKAESFLNVGYQRLLRSSVPAAASTGGAASRRSSGPAPMGSSNSATWRKSTRSTAASSTARKAS